MDLGTTIEVFQALLDPREAMTVAVRVQLSPSGHRYPYCGSDPRAARSTAITILPSWRASHIHGPRA